MIDSGDIGHVDVQGTSKINGGQISLVYINIVVSSNSNNNNNYSNTNKNNTNDNNNKNINDIIATFSASVISIISHNNDGCINNKNYYNSNYVIIYSSSSRNKIASTMIRGLKLFEYLFFYMIYLSSFLNLYYLYMMIFGFIIYKI